MAIQIPKGDNLGNTLPQVGRTRLQGGNGAVGRALIGLGREVQGIAARLEYDKEQTNQVEMRNAVLEREKQVNNLRNDTDQRIKMGELDPEQAIEEFNTKLNTLPRKDINGLTRNQQETLNYYYNATDYRGQQQAFGIYQQGLVTKAQTAISEYARLANEDPNANIDSVLAGLDNEAMDTTFRTAFGQKAVEAKAGLKRDLLLSNLQNKSTIAADNGNYQALKQFKSDVMKADFYKGVLQNDDRVKLAHSANVGLDQIDSRNKRYQAEAKQAANAQYAALKESIYMDMLNGKTFDQIDTNKLSLLKAKDLDFFKGFKAVKQSDPSAVEDISYRIKMGEDIDLTRPDIIGKITASDINSFAKKKADLKANPKEAERMVGRLSEFTSMASDASVDTKTTEFKKIANETEQAIEEARKKKGSPLTLQEERNIMLTNFAKVSMNNKKPAENPLIQLHENWFGDDSKYLYQIPPDQRSQYQVENIDDIPADTRASIERAFKGNGINYSDSDVVRKYNDWINRR